eukprot:c20413_g1_i2.p1 GENE.c20413_g1_i2~~c20413_g1_i2.p1  ORF type:complete len:537 (-),score=85.69 c20413_g1_i2:1296-2906(-)
MKTRPAPWRSSPSRWLVFVAGMFVELAAGTGYAFGIYSAVLKHQDGLGFSQSEVDEVATFGNMGLYLSVTGGLFFDRFGSAWTLFCGGLMGGIGFSLIYLSIAGHFGQIPSTCVGVFNFISQLGSAWIGVAVITVCVQNFAASDRGKVVGLLKAFFGLSSALLSEIYSGIFSPNQYALVLFFAVAVPTITWCFTPLIVLLPPAIRSSYVRDHNPNPSFTPFAILTIGVAAIVTTAVLVQTVVYCNNQAAGECVPRFAPRVSFLVASLFALFLTALSPRWYGPVLVAPPNLRTTPLILSYASSPQRDDSQPLLVAQAEHLTVWQSVRTLRIWLLFAAILMSAGSGLIVINNITQITQSIVGPKHSYLGLKTVLVAVLGCFNCGGRLVAGFVTDKFARTIPRTLFLAVWISIMAASMALLTAFGNIPALSISVALMAFSYGLIFSTSASLVGDLFGTAHYGANYGVVDFAPAVGSLIFATKVAGTIYDRHAHEGGQQGRVCYGHECYQLTFAIATIASCLGVGCSLLLWRNTRHLQMR